MLFLHFLKLDIQHLVFELLHSDSNWALLQQDLSIVLKDHMLMELRDLNIHMMLSNKGINHTHLPHTLTKMLFLPTLTNLLLLHTPINRVMRLLPRLILLSQLQGELVIKP